MAPQEACGRRHWCDEALEAGIPVGALTARNCSDGILGFVCFTPAYLHEFAPLWQQARGQRKDGWINLAKPAVVLSAFLGALVVRRDRFTCWRGMSPIGKN